jgi:L-2,4-diaminobutyrate decarboxylase
MDADFLPDADGLHRAVDLLASIATRADGLPDWPDTLPETGIGPRQALEQLAPAILGGAARLGAATAFAHMDPPTPWITWATTLWNAALNQNLLHPATAPVARLAEARVVGWLAPFFGMDGGHMTPGSTVANLTALWAARDIAGVDEVVASEAAHLSIAKAAHLLGLRCRALPVDRCGALRPEALEGDLGRSALVLTAGTTSTGAIDPLALAGRAAWTHVDAAWAGPSRLSGAHAELLDGIADADSVAVSAHKWLFQPKESALVMFRDTGRAHAALSFGGAYLASPNIGLLGSHGAVAVPLLATLLAWGREGLAARIEHCLRMAGQLAQAIADTPSLQLLAPPQTGIVVWRPRDPCAFDRVLTHMPGSAVSTTTLAGERWLRCVAANPNADLPGLIAAVQCAAPG